MEKKNELTANEIQDFPEFENIRKAILEAREKVAVHHENVKFLS